MTQELLRVCVSSVCQHRSEKSSLNSNFQLFYRLQSTVHAGGKKRDTSTCTTDESDVFYTHSIRDGELLCRTISGTGKKE